MIISRALAATGVLFGLLSASVAAQAPGDEAATAQITKADFFKPGIAPVRNDRDYDLTIVYFFDYQCPVCRRYHADVSRALAEDKKVRVIYRDTPMLGGNSDAAAYAALAANRQGRHEALHHAMMSTKGPLDEQALRAAAAKARVDWDRLQRDIKAHKSRMDDQIARNFELATDTGIYGTPAFIIGDSLANGALDYAGLKGEIADARKSLASGASQPAPNGKPAEMGQSRALVEPLSSERPAAAAASDRQAAVFRKSNAGIGDPGKGAAQASSTSSLPSAWLAAAAALLAAAAAFARRRQRRTADS